MGGSEDEVIRTRPYPDLSPAFATSCALRWLRRYRERRRTFELPPKDRNTSHFRAWSNRCAYRIKVQIGAIDAPKVAW